MLKTITSDSDITNRYKYRKYSLPLAVAVLFIFHIVGLWGLLFSGEPVRFQNLTPLNLLLTNALLFAFHRSWNKTFVIFSILVFSVGFISEVVGVHTGLLFGEYNYGDSLGYKLWEVPVLIGLNWLMLVYVTGHISNYTKWPWAGKAFLAALLMVLLDFFIEPVATQFDFWSWRQGEIPLSNYAGWLALAFILQAYFQKASFDKSNPLAPFVYLIQLLFFASIYFLLVPLN